MTLRSAITRMPSGLVDRLFTLRRNDGSRHPDL